MQEDFVRLAHSLVEHYTILAMTERTNVVVLVEEDK